jgi:hypothetical protein
LGQLCEYADELPAAQAQNQTPSARPRSRMVSSVGKLVVFILITDVELWI